MLSNNQAQYVQYVEDAIINDVFYKHNKTRLEKIAQEYGILDQNHVKELTELAIVLRARFLAHEPNKTVKQKFEKIVSLYNKQVNLSHRTSQSMLLQQYSTPAPIAYLMGVFCGIDKPGNYFEPSAGNGLLSIAGSTGNFIVNEIEDFRNENLKSQGYKQVTQIDGSEPLPYSKQFDAILTNPPFGRLNKKLSIKSTNGTFDITDLDHAMAIHALNTMKDNGKAAIIIGGHTTWDDKGRIQAGKNRTFFSYLYSHYNVVDVILIDGHKLYSRQGTAFNVRLILIDGRKYMPGGFAPLKTKHSETIIGDFNWLYEIITSYQTSGTSILELEAEALELELELMTFEGLSGLVDDTYNKAIITYRNDKIRRSPLIVGFPNALLQSFGIKNKAIYLDYDIIKKATLNKHWLRVDDFISLGRKINNPIAIFNSLTHKTSSKIILIDVVDSLKRRVIVILRLDNKNHISITSVYGKNSKQQLLEWEKRGLLLFKDKKKWDYL